MRARFCAVAPLVAMTPLSIFAGTPASWLAPVSGNWTDATKWSTNPTYPRNGSPLPTDAYAVVIDATDGTGTYTVDFSPVNALAIDTLRLNSPTARLDVFGGTLTVATSADVQSGTLQVDFNGALAGGNVGVASGAAVFVQGGVLGGPGTMSLAAGARMDVTTGNLDRSLQNAGTVNISSAIYVRAGTFTNGAGGVCNIAPAFSPFGSTQGAPGGRVVNNGTMNFNSGGTFSSDTSFGSPLFINNGTFNVWVGDFFLNLGGGGTFTNGSVVQGAGRFMLGQSGTAYEGSCTLSTAGVSLAGGAIGGSGTLTITSPSFEWTSGSMVGAGTTVLASGVAVSTYNNGFPGTYSLWRALRNATTITFDNGGNLEFNNGTLLNEADGVLKFDGFETTLRAGAATGAIVNSGSLLVRGAMLGRTSWNNSGSLTIGGGGSLLIRSTSPAISFINTGTLTNDGCLFVNYTSGTTSAGNIDGVGSVVVQATPNFAVSRIRQTSLRLEGSSTVVVQPNGSDAACNRLSALTFTSQTGQVLDLNDNDVIAGIDAAITLFSRIKTARNGGLWNGPGVTSTTARNDPSHATTLGLLPTADYYKVYGSGASFDGLSTAGSTAIVKYTYYGDTDFDGRVTFDDYVRTDLGFNLHRTGWFNGDFNYDGVVNFDDYVLIDIAFNTQNGTLSRAIDWISGDDRSQLGSGQSATGVQTVIDHFEEFGLPYAQHFLAAIPEPAIVTTLTSSVLPAVLLRHRRR